MNSLKCGYGVLAGKFFSFIIYEHGIEIDSKEVEVSRKSRLLHIKVSCKVSLKR
jgi:hypothetical protein